MKMRLAAGAAVVLVLGSVAAAAPMPPEPACQEVSGGVRYSLLASSYRSNGVRLDKQRGSSACVSSATDVSCLLNDPGRVTVSSGGASKTFKAPLRAKVRVTAKGGQITCRVLNS